MTINLSRPWRLGIYVVNLLGTPVAVYARAKGWIGDMEMTLWGAEVTAAFALAGLNIPAPVESSGPLADSEEAA